jgi:hypothetical protein
MRLYDKTLAQINHLVNLSKTGTCAACYAAEFHGTKQYAIEAVAKHRAISREVREHIQRNLNQLDDYDREVEQHHQTLRRLSITKGKHSDNE